MENINKKPPTKKECKERKLCFDCTTKTPDCPVLLDKFNLCYFCHYNEEEKKALNEIAEKTKEVKEIAKILPTIKETICYCGDKACEFDCGVLWCGCIDCCRCAADK